MWNTPKSLKNSAIAIKGQATTRLVIQSGDSSRRGCLKPLFLSRNLDYLEAKPKLFGLFGLPTKPKLFGIQLGQINPWANHREVATCLENPSTRRS